METEFNWQFNPQEDDGVASSDFLFIPGTAEDQSNFLTNFNFASPPIATTSAFQPSPLPLHLRIDEYQLPVDWTAYPSSTVLNVDSPAMKTEEEDVVGAVIVKAKRVKCPKPDVTHHRGNIACARCRRQKMRCINEGGLSACQRCTKQRAECLFEKLPTTPSAQERPVRKRRAVSIDDGWKSSDPDLSTAHVKLLLEFFFHWINPSWALLDETYHTPSFISSRSPFLLLSICMITSRYLPALDIYATLLVRVVEGASSYIIKGDRSIESVQAYLLLAMYLVQAPDHSDQSWLYICHASRLAADLGLQRSISLADNDESLNRKRTWMLVVSLDRSYSLQRGRIATLSSDVGDHLCCATNPNATCIAGYTELQGIALKAINKLRWEENVDYGSVTSEFEGVACQWREKLNVLLNQKSSIDALPQQQRFFFSQIFEFYQHYWTLVVFSFGLQHAIEQNSLEIAYYFTKTASAANQVVRCTIDKLSKHPYFRVAPESRYVFPSYAAVCLLKFLRPDLQQYVPKGSNLSTAMIEKVVLELSDCLSSVAVDDQHMASLSSDLLRVLCSERELRQGHGEHHSDESKLCATMNPERLTYLKPIVATILRPGSWNSMIVSGFDGGKDERDSTGNFLR